jgi:hypothetical protein
LSERGKVEKGAERKVKNHFIDHSYHFIPNALLIGPAGLPRSITVRQQLLLTAAAAVM